MAKKKSKHAPIDSILLRDGMSGLKELKTTISNEYASANTHAQRHHPNAYTCLDALLREVQTLVKDGVQKKLMINQSLHQNSSQRAVALH